ncbi:YsnF/AvaK domain-containing protein [Azospirillum picis]|uniref:Uncharacterized protein (TIGR02271 family) n=1 Tax=Azospirillum picis TaxID=488438 RepID=A0ABU0MET8_9PROT|nr:YsnF/AvaK domain-containing protein [Azospirillum picis]MBP2298120.1 uncharacterized protein (TIGR02271 family) [Azospirillum picis]MDQ0531958.1 uncharacterized protein (TIGR02271 family) [Azospirillum picis]
MSKTIVALYDHRSDATAASQDLQAAGFDAGIIDVLSHADLAGSDLASSDLARSGQAGGTDWSGSGSGTGLTGDSSIGAAAGMARTDLSTGYVASPNTVPPTTGTTAGGMLSRIAGWGVPNHDAQVYAEGVRRGGTLLKLRVDEDDVDRAMEVLERGNIVDVEERGTAYRNSGWTGFDESAGYYDERSADEERMRYTPGQSVADERLSDAAGAMREANVRSTGPVTGSVTGSGIGTGVGSEAGMESGRRGTAEREERIPLVEEQVQVGKRSVERGGVRVRSYVVETPVEEQVRLRDETVTVERQPGGMVEGAGAEVPADAFRERTIEVSETDEEAVVSKTAHVRETVVVRKDVAERAETVRDTVRRTEVEVEDMRDKTDRRSDLDR